MSRAFIKESDLEDLDPLPERTHSDLPNYITHEGLNELKRRISNLKDTVARLRSSDQFDAPSHLAYAQRDLGFYEERLRRAIPVDPPKQFETVRFGHTVTLADANGRRYRFTLVGEDETDVEAGRISWASPIATQLLNCRLEDEIIWTRGSDRLVLEIIEIGR